MQLFNLFTSEEWKLNIDGLSSCSFLAASSSMAHSLKANLCLVAWQKWHNFNKKKLLDTFIWCCKPGELGSVVDIVTFCCVMRLDSGHVAMEIILTELPSWYSCFNVKCGYHGDNWNLSTKHKFKISPCQATLIVYVERRSVNKPLVGWFTEMQCWQHSCY